MNSRQVEVGFDVVPWPPAAGDGVAGSCDDEVEGSLQLAQDVGELGVALVRGELAGVTRFGAGHGGLRESACRYAEELV
ncbi:MAG TPA: hypothetical protein VJM32_01720 [Candidatus Saccharimonadales bacterium]|nr:hypothetical protein [Candidatus Saccharimonadales bacterium]